MSAVKSGTATGATMPAAQPMPQQQQARPQRPNYRHLHRFPLPIDTYPLPPLIPHNPLSLLTVAFTYLYQRICPPKRRKFAAYFDALTSSVHVTDPIAIRALWEMGFFGKGSLSRSEPSWLDREKKRLGLLAGSTAEEVTRARRNERREMKLERARKEREAIAEQLRLEAQRKAGLNGGDEALLEDTAHEKTMEESVRNILVDETAMQESVASELQEVASTLTSDGKTISSSKFTETPIQPADKSPLPELMPEEDIELHNEEHLQLSLEEAFFLVYGLGVLELYPEAGTAQSEALTATSLFGLFRRCSYYPSRDALLPYEPDDNFIVSYVIYHHFRSLGWVVRSGVKFGVDYILYNRGPVFSHAEFAVIVLPSYSHPYWSADPARRLYVEQRTNKTWSWLHCVNRVQAQVKKTLVLCYVEIPPPDAPDAAGDGVDIGEILRRYIVREMCIRRWVPNRTRD